MAKLKNPLLSLSALGALGKDLVIRGRGRSTIAEKKPHPRDAKSPAQLAWRPMYKACTVLWHLLSDAEKQEWERNATPRHMIGYAWFMSQCLRPNPGIYLPLAGGTMKGDVDMDGNKITGLPVPTLDPDAATKAYVDGAAVPPDYPMKLKPNIARYVLPGWYADGAGLVNAVAGRIYYIPIFVTETTTYIRICIAVSVGAAGTADLRIFNWDNGLPGSLLLSAGAVDTTAAGFKEIVIAQQLTRGYYFLAIRCTATPKMYSPNPANSCAPPVPGIKTNEYPNPDTVLPYVSAAYADPAPAPTGMRTIDYAFVFLREN